MSKLRPAYDTRWNEPQKWANAPTEDELALLRPVSDIHRRIQADPGQDEGSRVTLYVGKPGAPFEEMTEVGRVLATDIAPNVTGGSITLTGVEPGDVVFNERGLPVGVADNRSALVHAGTFDAGQISSFASAFGGAVMPFAHMGQVMAAAAEEVRRAVERIRDSYGGQSWPVLTMSEWTWHRLTHTTLRGRAAIKWIQSRTPAQRSHLRLISTPQYPVLSTKRAAKRQRKRERVIRELLRSCQRLSQ